MRGHIKLCLITAWLTAALLVLLMGTNLCVSTDEACLAAGETMFLLMLLLSFPTESFSSSSQCSFSKLTVFTIHLITLLHGS